MHLDVFHAAVFTAILYTSIKLGTLDDFEFMVDYASTISLDTVFKIS